MSFNPIELAKKVEQWVWRKTEENAWWNLLTWAGHAAVVAASAYAFDTRAGEYLLDLLFPYMNGASFGAAFGIGFYSIREAVSLYRGWKAPESWPEYWKYLDPAGDVVAAWVSGILMAGLL